MKCHIAVANCVIGFYLPEEGQLDTPLDVMVTEHPKEKLKRTVYRTRTNEGTQSLRTR